MNYCQICRDIDEYDLHADTWNPVELAQSSFSHFVFYGPAGVGKYAHAIHFLRQWGPFKPGSFFHLEQEVPMLSHYAKLPPQSFSFPTSHIHMEIDMEQLGNDPLSIWNAVVERASDTFLFILCRHLDKAPAMLLDRLYTYLHPQWPPKETPHLRFLFLTENIGNLPASLLSQVQIVSFPRPSMDQYMECARHLVNQISPIGMEQPSGTMSLTNPLADPRDIIQIPEYVTRWKLPSSHKIDADDPFGPLCEKMVECIQSVHSEDTVYLFSIEDIKHILTEWEMYHVCYEEGIWYVLGRFIALHQLTSAQVKTLVHAWGQSGSYANTPHSIRYNEKRAEYMISELISVLYTPS
jgi:hypothetical protein